jgi:hypothetical protein
VGKYIIGSVPCSERAIHNGALQVRLRDPNPLDVSLEVEPDHGVVVARALASGKGERHVQTATDLVQDFPLEPGTGRRRLIGLHLAHVGRSFIAAVYGGSGGRAQFSERLFCLTAQ